MSKEHDVYSGLGAEADSSHTEDNQDFFSEEILPSEVETKAEESEQIKEGEIRVVELLDEIDDANETEKKNGNSHESEIEFGSMQASVRDLSLSENIDLKKDSLGDNTKVTDKDEDERKNYAKQIQRAECIAESLSEIKIFPLLGSPSILDKVKYENMFDGIFVSARSAQCIEKEYFKKLLRTKSKSRNTSSEYNCIDSALPICQQLKENQLGSIIAIETAKFLVPLSKKQQKEFNIKEEEYASMNKWTKINPPVSRRRRDELDLEDDVIFYRN